MENSVNCSICRRVIDKAEAIKMTNSIKTKLNKRVLLIRLDITQPTKDENLPILVCKNCIERHIISLRNAMWKALDNLKGV